MKRTINGWKALRPTGNHPNPSYWVALRAKKLEEQGAACACCPNDNQSGYQLELHHRHYENWGKEKPEDVVILCSLCHDYITSRFRFLDDYTVETGALPPPRPGLPAVEIRPVEQLQTAKSVERPGLPVDQKSTSQREQTPGTCKVSRTRPF
jgi:hypothetical protein